MKSAISGPDVRPVHLVSRPVPPQAHAATATVTRSMWKRALRALDVGVEAAASPQCAVPLQARLELVTAIGTLHSALRPVFDEQDLLTMFAWLEKFVRNPWSADDSNSVMPGADIVLAFCTSACWVLQQH